MKTYSLAEVAAMALPPEWKDAERWLNRRLNRNELRGVRLNRTTWRMRESDIEYMLDRYSNQAEPAAIAEPASVVDGLSARSRRRLRRTA